MISGVSLISCNIFLHGAVEFQGVVPRQRPMAVSAQCVVFWGLPENRFQILNAYIYIHEHIYTYIHIYIYIYIDIYSSPHRAVSLSKRQHSHTHTQEGEDRSKTILADERCGSTHMK